MNRVREMEACEGSFKEVVICKQVFIMLGEQTKSILYKINNKREKEHTCV